MFVGANVVAVHVLAARACLLRRLLLARPTLTKFSSRRRVFVYCGVNSKDSSAGALLQIYRLLQFDGQKIGQHKHPREAGRWKSVNPSGRQRVRSVLTTEGQQGGTDEDEQGDDCTETRRAVITSLLALAAISSPWVTSQGLCSAENSPRRHRSLMLPNPLYRRTKSARADRQNPGVAVALTFATDPARFVYSPALFAGSDRRFDQASEPLFPGRAAKRPDQYR
ncbi:MAG: hypothetical protein J07HN4v3_02280 [Halonotius sp. J07HN4]|nr:MAG: hypothetical protein J07HN4v3_02280 [Halonotius sp. J07HN4]